MLVQAVERPAQQKGQGQVIIKGFIHPYSLTVPKFNPSPPPQDGHEVSKPFFAGLECSFPTPLSEFYQALA